MPSLSSVLDDSAALLEGGPHPERARRDAETLLLHVLGKNRAWLIAHGSEGLPDELYAGYAAMVERRRCGEPIQYITGEQEFYGLPFRVTPDVLIPRPETEHIVEKVLELAAILDSSVTGHGFSRAESCTKLDRALAPGGFPRILDVGTGSGAIAIALAHHLPNAQITALDISPAALEVARENSFRNGVADHIRFLESDLLDAVARERFDFVVSNPPYVPTADRNSLSVEVREYEPADALFAGNDGLDLYRRLIPAAFAALVPRGSLLIEIGYSQAEPVAGLLADAGFNDVDFGRDLQGIPRVACARRSV